MSILCCERPWVNFNIIIMMCDIIYINLIFIDYSIKCYSIECEGDQSLPNYIV